MIYTGRTALLLCLSMQLCANIYSWLEPFDRMMFIARKTDLNTLKAKLLLDVDGTVLLDHFKNIYNQELLKTKPRKGIEKKIHQIWLGSPLPEKLKKWQKKLQQLHPGWEYKLWTDADVKKLTLQNQDLYDLAVNYGMKSDILRCELLYQFGGVYLDLDIECLKPLDKLHEQFDFYAGFEPLWQNSRTCLSIGNSIIGATKGHPFMKCCIDSFKEKFFDKIKQPVLNVVIKTGPVFFTKCCFKYVGTFGYRDIVLPSAYFYPYPIYRRNPLSFCVHYWDNSWFETKPRSVVKPKKLNVRLVLTS